MQLLGKMNQILVVSGVTGEGGERTSCFVTFIRILQNLDSFILFSTFTAFQMLVID